MGEPETPHFYDFGVFERVPEPQNHVFLSLETPGYLTKIKKHPWNIVKHIFFINPKCWESRILTFFEKARTNKHNKNVCTDKSRRSSDKILRSLNMRSISTSQHEMDIL